MRLLRSLARYVDSRDILTGLGAASVATGLGVIYWPAAPIFVGCLLLFLALGGVYRHGDNQ